MGGGWHAERACMGVHCAAARFLYCLIAPSHNSMNEQYKTAHSCHGGGVQEHVVLIMLFGGRATVGNCSSGLLLRLLTRETGERVCSCKTLIAALCHACAYMLLVVGLTYLRSSSRQSGLLALYVQLNSAAINIGHVDGNQVRTRVQP
jgi:hypothetical protein